MNLGAWISLSRVQRKAAIRTTSEYRMTPDRCSTSAIGNIRPDGTLQGRTKDNLKR